MAEIVWHRRETRRQTEKTNIYLNGGEAPAYSPTVSAASSGGRCPCVISAQAVSAAGVLRGVRQDHPGAGAVGAGGQRLQRAEAWIKRVDDALYLAKSGERNRVCLATCVPG